MEHGPSLNITDHFVQYSYSYNDLSKCNAAWEVFEKVVNPNHVQQRPCTKPNRAGVPKLQPIPWRRKKRWTDRHINTHRFGK